MHEGARSAPNGALPVRL